MTGSVIFQLEEISVIDVDGVDAPAILHNLTTAAVKELTPGESVETFITDVRGKTLGHVYACRTKTGYRLIGSPGQSQTIVEHLDRYTIREDSVPTIRDQELTALVIPPNADSSWIAEIQDSFNTIVGWLGADTRILLVKDIEAVKSIAKEVALDIGVEAGFHSARVNAGFPWHGIDFDEKNLPQETCRHDAISFTKGCYLGQETVARLDALGQVQKQLMKWSVDDANVAPGIELHDGDKLVGRLTSIAKPTSGKSIAIGIARRSHFEAGSAASNGKIKATIVGPI